VKTTHQLGQTGRTLKLGFGEGGGAGEVFEWYFDYNRNGGGQSAFLVLFGANAQPYTLETLSGFNASGTLTATTGGYGYKQIDIDAAYEQGGTGIKTTGFTVSSTTGLIAYFYNKFYQSSSATLLFGQRNLGLSYAIASIGGWEFEPFPYYKSMFSVRAILDATDVTIVLCAAAGGGTVNVTLDAGETYRYESAVDLTGTMVTSTELTAVFAGHDLAQVPVGARFGDVLISQALAEEFCSTTYYVAASPGAEITTSDIIRVLAFTNSTDVSIDGVFAATINRGGYHEFTVAASTGKKITTTQPVAVAHYLRGGNGGSATIAGQLTYTDPELAYIVPPTMWLQGYLVYCPSDAYLFGTGYFLDMIVKTAELGTLEIDGALTGATGFTTIDGTYSRGRRVLAPGKHTMACAEPFFAVLYGSALDESVWLPLTAYQYVV
jgi:hypothetical protein